MDLSPDALRLFLQPIATWKDWLDVLLVTLVLYNLLLLIRGTRAVQVVLGILVLVLIYYGARWLDLRALETTLENFFVVLPVAILILFQHEIRRALARFGRSPLGRFGGSGGTVRDRFADIVMAASTLSDRRIGALVVFERQEGLRNYIENGIQLDAETSLDLLITLFHPESPTQDGAVIVQGERLAAAACFLPLTRNPEVSTGLGTRHRAALGISEDSDALALVVSEETGDISLAVSGQMHTKLSSATLETLLFKYLLTTEDPGRGLLPEAAKP